jgi:hypothetical protein
MSFLNRFFNYKLLIALALASVMLFLPYTGFAVVDYPEYFHGPDEYCDKYCGVWEYHKRPGKNLPPNKEPSYFKIVRISQGKYMFTPGYEYEGEIVWQEPALEDIHGNPTEGIYLKPSNGKLKGSFFSSNFWATHSIIHSIEITVDSKSSMKVIYSVKGVIGEKTNKFDTKPEEVYEATLLEE